MTAPFTNFKEALEQTEKQRVGSDLSNLATAHVQVKEAMLEEQRRHRAEMARLALLQEEIEATANRYENGDATVHDIKKVFNKARL